MAAGVAIDAAPDGLSVGVLLTSDSSNQHPWYTLEITVSSAGQ